MTRHELIEKISDGLEVTKKQCDEAVDVLIREVVAATDKDGKVVIPGFGTFKAVESNERTGRNPQDGRMYEYPKKRKMKFKASSLFTEELNG